MIYALVLERVDSVCSLLDGQAKVEARRVVQLAKELAGRPRDEKRAMPQTGDDSLRKELGRLIEVLSRRSSQAIPAATLARAVLADLFGDLASREQTLRECDQKLMLQGL